MIDRSDDEGRFLAYSSLILIVEDNVPSIERVNGRETLDFVSSANSARTSATSLLKSCSDRSSVTFATLSVFFDRNAADVVDDRQVAVRKRNENAKRRQSVCKAALPRVRDHQVRSRRKL